MNKGAFSCQTGLKAGVRNRRGAGAVAADKFVTIGGKTVYAPSVKGVFSQNPVSHSIAELGISGAIDSADELRFKQKMTPSQKSPKKKFLGMF